MNIKDDLTTLKSKLENIEGQLEGQMKELNEREQNWSNLDKEVEAVLAMQNNIIKFNVGGKKFASSTDTLLKIPDTLFYKIITSKIMDLTEEIFFDRSPTFFGVLLDFLRNNKITYKRFSKEDLKTLAIEAEYYEVN